MKQTNNNPFFIDFANTQINYAGERICGDNFLCERVSSGTRTIFVLSDGMGHGVKANILSTLTSTMLLKFLSTNEDISTIAEMLVKTLPVCSVRKISYSTFTIIDVNNLTGEVDIVEYDNPRTVILRGERSLDLQWSKKTISSNENRAQQISLASFVADKGDRMVVVSDGVTQSGQRTELYKFGWGDTNFAQFLASLVSYNKNISSADLGLQVVSKACQNDGGKPSDDISCLSLYFRDMRKLLLVSCPPAMKEDYPAVASLTAQYDGERVVCGYRVAEIIAEANGWPIKRDEFSADPVIPPMWHIEPLDLVTEGLVTLGRVLEMLEEGDSAVESGSASDRLHRRLLRADHIDFVIGTLRNTGAVYQTDEFDVRRKILNNIANVLRTRYKKEIFITFL